MATLLKKLSVKNVCGNIIAPPPGEEKKMMILMGFAKSFEVKPTTFGDSIGFHGDFKAVDMDTGEEFRSGVCYLPDVAESLLKNAMDVNAGVVEFAFEIGLLGVKGRTEGEVGKYEYRCKPMMKASENDPMLVLEERLKHGLIDAPKKAEKPHEPQAAKKGGK